MDFSTELGAVLFHTSKGGQGKTPLSHAVTWYASHKMNVPGYLFHTDDNEAVDISADGRKYQQVDAAFAGSHEYPKQAAAGRAVFEEKWNLVVNNAKSGLMTIDSGGNKDSWAQYAMSLVDAVVVPTTLEPQAVKRGLAFYRFAKEHHDNVILIASPWTSRNDPRVNAAKKMLDDSGIEYERICSGGSILNLVTPAEYREGSSWEPSGTGLTAARQLYNVISRAL